MSPSSETRGKLDISPFGVRPSDIPLQHSMGSISLGLRMAEHPGLMPIPLSSHPKSSQTKRSQQTCPENQSLVILMLKPLTLLTLTAGRFQSRLAAASKTLEAAALKNKMPGSPTRTRTSVLSCMDQITCVSRLLTTGRWTTLAPKERSRLTS